MNTCTRFFATTALILAGAVAISASPALAQSTFTADGPGTISASTAGNTATFTFVNSDRFDVFNLVGFLFQTTADRTGTYTFSYDVNGFNADGFFEGDVASDAYDQVLFEADTPGDYSKSGTFNLNLVQGHRYGISVEGENDDPVAQFSGTIHLTSEAIGAVPEPATWGMMILGMGAIGYAMRRKVRASEVKFDARIKRIAAGEIA